MTATNSFRRLTVESLEARDCPTILLSPPAVVPPPPTYDVTVTGVSTGDQEDLIVINPVSLGTVEILHHRGKFHLVNGIVAVDANTTATLVSRQTLLTTTSLRIVVNAGVGDDFVVNNTYVKSTLRGSDGYDYLVGGSAADTIEGGNEPLQMAGKGDTIIGQGGNDILSGNGGHDHILGGTGSDTLNGNEGNDYLNGGTGSDTLNGGDGYDGLIAGMDYDVDYLNGGADIDDFFRDWYLEYGNIHSTVDVLVGPIDADDTDHRP